MRISTTQFHQQALSRMQRQQAKVMQSELQIASGKRIMTPSDDPVGAVRVLNLNSNISTVEQYSRNIAQAQTSLAYQESVLTSVNDSLQRIRELTLQASSPANHSTARVSIANEMQEQLNALKTLANTRDASGDYIFAGFRVDQAPFVDNAGVVSYHGDQGRRLVQIGEGVQVAVRDAGDSIFMNIPGGDGTVQVLPAADNGGSVVVKEFGSTNTFVPDTYTLTFAQDAPGLPLQFSVTDSARPTPVVVSSGSYVDGSTLNVEGAQFTLAGTPLAGDTVTIQPAARVDMFALVSAMTTALTATGSGPAAQAKLQNALTQGLANLDQAMNTINNQRASVGARLNNIDSVDTINQDFKLQLETVLSATEDLDYAEAITRFNLQLSALEAAQQAYIKTSELSLFRYL